MYHCHFEDVEHVQMGMTGHRSSSGRGRTAPSLGGFNKFAYNDGDGSTGYDREFALLLNEIFVEAHYQDAHIQTTDWTDFNAGFCDAERPHLPGHRSQPNGDPLIPTAGRLSTSRSRR